MEKKPEVDGSWVECEASELIENIDAIEDSQILAVNATRMELGGEDKKQFVDKFKKIAEEFASEMEGMNDSQKSFYIVRKMVIS